MAKKPAVPEALEAEEHGSDVGAVFEQARARVLQGTQASLNDEGLRLAIPAPNAIEWVVGERWCNVPSVYEVTRQYQVVRDLFELRCPLCNAGGTGPGEPGDCMPGDRPRTRMYLESEVLLRWNGQYEEDVCPKCNTTKSELIEDGLANGYNQFHLIVGQRAGKSVVSALIGSYVEHRMITLGLNHPGGFGGYLGITIKDPFEVTFLASTDSQSQDTIWAKYVAVRTESPWFQRYCTWVTQEEAKQVAVEGMRPWTYRETDKRIWNGHPRAHFIFNSLNSNAPGLRGRTRPAAFADEISHMEQSDSKHSATEIYRALEASLKTVRQHTRFHGGLPWLGLMASVSSPVSRTDKGWRLLNDAEKIPDMYARRWSTWEFNPMFPRKDFDNDFKKDPVGAARDFGASPPGTQHALIHDEVRWREASVDFDLKPRATFEVHEVMTPTGHRMLAAKLKSAEIIRDRNPRYIAADAGQNFDAFAIACAHGEALDNGTRATVFDWVVRVLPLPGTEVSFHSVFELFRDLRRYFPIAAIEFDRWQSLQMIQQVRDLGLQAERKPSTKKDYMTFKLDSFSELVRMLPPLPSEYKGDRANFDWTVDPPDLSAPAAAIYELLNLQQDPDTMDISNPNKGERRGWNSNDVAQVIVHAHRLVQTQGYTEKQNDTSRTARRQRAQEGVQSWGDRGGLARGKPNVARSLTKNPRGW